ncbi:MAG: acylphosphatase [Anaerolineaceae bacterium]
MQRLHAIVVGRVQGVGFRYFVKRQAESLSLTGWLRNLSEGQVEMIAEGCPDAINKLLGLISLGPSGAIVIEVTQNRSRGTGEFTDFRIDV